MNHAEPNLSPPGRRAQRCLALGKRLVVVLVVFIVLVELGGRYIVGLGRMPLYVADDQIEYVLAPDQHIRRRNTLIETNRYGMRAADFEPTKSNADELRVMVISDSITAHTARSQEHLATELLRDKLAAVHDGPVAVGNIAAGSWGPANQLAYVRAHGLFDADCVILVLNTEDASDVPDFDPAKLKNLTDPPRSAWGELLTIRLPRLLVRFGWREPASTSRNPHVYTEDDIDQALAALGDLIGLIRGAGLEPLIVRHSARPAAVPALDQRDEILDRWLAAHDLQTVDLGARFMNAGASAASMYHDRMHLSIRGQQELADVLFELAMNTAEPRDATDSEAASRE
jgi:hypothetical protein